MRVSYVHEASMVLVVSVRLYVCLPVRELKNYLSLIDA